MTSAPRGLVVTGWTESVYTLEVIMRGWKEGRSHPRWAAEVNGYSPKTDI